MPGNPHDDDRESVIARLRRIRDMLLGREESKITEIDSEVDALTLAMAEQFNLLNEQVAALTASQTSQDTKLDAILAILAAPEELTPNFTFSTPQPK